MAGNIRTLGTMPKIKNGIPDPTARDVLIVAFLFPIATPESLQDTLTAKAEAAAPAKGVLVPDAEPVALDAGWKTVPSAVAYRQSGGTMPIGVDAIAPEVAAILTDEDKAAIQAGALTVPSLVQVALEDGWTLADLSDPFSPLRKTINLMWNQAFKNFTDHLEADRARIAAPDFGMVLDEMLIADLANVPDELKP